jgi:hypothetical protein
MGKAMPPLRAEAAAARMADSAANRFWPLYDAHPLTGAAIEVFYADRTLETFGRCGSWLVLVESPSWGLA